MILPVAYEEPEIIQIVVFMRKTASAESILFKSIFCSGSLSTWVLSIYVQVIWGLENKGSLGSVFQNVTVFWMAYTQKSVLALVKINIFKIH